MNRKPESIIRDIIIKELSITDINSIWVRDQNKEIPNDQGVYIIVGMVDSQIISNSSLLEDDKLGNPDSVKEKQRIQARENIQIDILSRDASVLNNRFDIILALSSIFSQQEQEKNSFKIFKLPASFVNSSDTEGGSKINRFSIVVSVHSWYYKEKVLSDNTNEYYDSFDTRVDDQNTIGQPNGIIQFTEDGS